MGEELEEKEKLPEYNPLKICPKCGKQFQIWGHYFNSQEKKWKIGHNFAPAVWKNSKIVDGIWHSQKIIEICRKCKVDEVVEKWKNP